jgi:hypothetical protein
MRSRAPIGRFKGSNVTGSAEPESENSQNSVPARLAGAAFRRPTLILVSLALRAPGERTGILTSGVSPLLAAIKMLLQPGTDFSPLGTFGRSVAYTGM